MTDETKLGDDEWRERLTSEQYRVLRQKGTEPAFTGRYWNCKDPGTYRCAGCGQRLFRSDTKFESGTGWPSFFDAVEPEAVRFEDDRTYGMHRIEVLCARCGSHLGHVFDDGPQPTGKRYCNNGAVLVFDAEENKEQEP